MNKAERVSKLAKRLGNLQRDLKKEGLIDVNDLISPAAMLLVKHGLEEYSKEYQVKR